MHPNLVNTVSQSSEHRLNTLDERVVGIRGVWPAESLFSIDCRSTMTNRTIVVHEERVGVNIEYLSAGR